MAGTPMSHCLIVTAVSEDGHRPAQKSNLVKLK